MSVLQWLAGTTAPILKEDELSLLRRSFLKSAAAGVLAAPVLSKTTFAQGYPNRTVRMVVATAPGGTADILARLLCQWLSERMGQTFVVENRTGGAGNIAVETVRQALPDGYTLHFSGPVNAINTSLYDRVNYLGADHTCSRAGAGAACGGGAAGLPSKDYS